MRNGCDLKSSRFNVATCDNHMKSPINTTTTICHASQPSHIPVQLSSIQTNSMDSGVARKSGQTKPIFWRFIVQASKHSTYPNRLQHIYGLKNIMKLYMPIKEIRYVITRPSPQRQQETFIRTTWFYLFHFTNIFNWWKKQKTSNIIYARSLQIYIR